jgi:acyl carrier protein
MGGRQPKCILMCGQNWTGKIMKKNSNNTDNWLAKVSAFLQTPSLHKPIADTPRKPETLPDALEIERWIAARLATRLGTPNLEIDPTVPFAHYGMDSQNALGLSGDLEEWLGTELSPTLVWDYPTVRQLASYLAAEVIRVVAGNRMNEIAGQQG